MEELSRRVHVHTTASQSAGLKQGWADIAATPGIGSYAIFRQTLPNGGDCGGHQRGFVRFDDSTADGLSGISFRFGSLLGGSFTLAPPLPPPPAM